MTQLPEDVRATMIQALSSMRKRIVDAQKKGYIHNNYWIPRIDAALQWLQHTAQQTSMQLEIERLRTELADLRKQGCYPMPDVSSGVLNAFQPLIDTANAPGEDEAWAHLQDTQICSECLGDGELEDHSHLSPPIDGDWPMIRCWKCNGTGKEPTGEGYGTKES